MALANHGVHVYEADTSVSITNKADVGIPFVLGVAPLASVDADDRAPANEPFLATSFAEAEAHLGYDEDWSDYGICEFMYHHFKLAQCQPVIFLPLTETIGSQAFDGDGTETEFTITAKPARVHDVTVGTAQVEIAAYDASTGKVTLKNAPAAGTGNVVAHYITPPSAASVAAAVDSIDLCMPMFGIVPDLICAPGFSDQATVAAAMAAKAGAVNGMFRAKAVVDIEAASYTAAVTAKNSGNYNEDMIVCWPYGKLGDQIFHMSTIYAGRISATDVANENVPYESPSNKPINVEGLCLADGTGVTLTLAQANVLNDAGICTGLNMFGSWRAWGNYTGCVPADTDVKNIFIPVSRMFDYIANTLIKTFWIKLDKPMNRRLIDSIMDSANIWLNGLVGREYLLGARVVMLEEENPVTDLMAGILHLHVYITPPSPAQEIDFTLEYDASYVESALVG